jgi:hypothetical protein
VSVEYFSLDSEIAPLALMAANRIATRSQRATVANAPRQLIARRFFS